MNLRRIKLQLFKEVNHLLSVLYFVGGLFEGWEDRTIAHSVNFIYFFFLWENLNYQIRVKSQLYMIMVAKRLIRAALMDKG